jgi:hypothetical protein
VRFRALFCAVGIAAFGAVPFGARAQAPKPAPAPATAPHPAQIDRNGVLILVRSTILALDQANKTGNYTVLRDLGAPGSRRTMPPGSPRFSPPSVATISIFPASPS